MRRTFDGVNASISAVGLFLTLAGCSTPLPPVSCAVSPSALSIQQAKDRGFSDGYHAGALAQALHDRARAREAASALFKSKGDPLLLATAMTLISPLPPASTQEPTVAAGPAVPLDKEWLGF